MGDEPVGEKTKKLLAALLFTVPAVVFYLIVFYKLLSEVADPPYVNLYFLMFGLQPIVTVTIAVVLSVLACSILFRED